MKILVIDCDGAGVDFAMRCQIAGHDVMHFMGPDKKGYERKDGDGIIPKVRDLEQLRKKWIGWADLIFLTDNAKYLDLLEPYRKIGYPIFGPSVAAAELELDREAGQKAMAKVGINTIPSRTFHDYDAAIAYVKEGRQADGEQAIRRC